MKNWESDIWRYLASELMGTELESFEQALKDDPILADKYESAQRLKRNLKDFPRLSPNEGFANRVMQKLPAGLNRNLWVQKLNRKPAWYFLGGAVLLVVVTLSIGWPQGSAASSDMDWTQIWQWSTQLPLSFVCLISAVFVLLLIDRVVTR